MSNKEYKKMLDEDLTLYIKRANELRKENKTDSEEYDSIMGAIAGINEELAQLEEENMY